MKKHGIYITEHKNWSTKKIFNKGYLMHTYHHQPKKIYFKSPMVNDINQHYCGGWFMEDVKYDNMSLVKRVLYGYKPMADLLYPEHEENMKIRKICKDNYLWWYDDGKNFMISRKGQILDLFDIAALYRDYCEAGITIELIDIYEKGFQDFMGDNWDFQDNNNTDPWITGLLMGYPIENTISLYLKKLATN